MKDTTVSPLNGLIEASSLKELCSQVRFAPGAVLRRKGQYYRDMYLITRGYVDIDRASGRGAADRLSSGPGFPIGEIGFLRGSPATATVTARTPTEAFLIDDSALARLEREQPAAAADLLRSLAAIAEERTSYNLVLTSSGWINGWRERIEVHLCRNKEMLERAQRLRYHVYCEELGRQSPYADHDRRIISDDLDETGHTFVAVEAGETIGTIRGNATSDGPLGILEELYGMRASPHHPAATAICTKFIITRARRGSLASLKLIAALVRYGTRYPIKQCYIDCIPALLPYYKAIGFTQSGPLFFHRENGPSYPMVIDLERHGKRLSDATGPLAYLKLIVKGKAIKLIDRFRDGRGLT